MKKNDIYDYFWDKILEDEEIKSLDENFYNKVVFNSFVALYDNLDSNKSYDIELTKRIRSFKRNNNVEEIYSLIKREYLYRYVKVNVKSKDFPKDLKRTILIPLRTSIFEMMIGVLSTLDTLGYHLLSLRKKDINFVTPIDEGGFNDFSALDNYTINILELKKLELWYDYGEDWLFDISFSNLEYLEEFVPFKILKYRGRGIIEDNKDILYCFLNNIENKYLKDYDLDDYFSETLEEISERSLSEYEPLLMAYLGIRPEFEDEEIEEN